MLDPKIAEFLENMHRSGTRQLSQSSVEETRAFMDLANLLVGEVEQPAETEDREIDGPAGGIPVRIYRPTAPGTAASPAGLAATGGIPGRPTVVWFHGGGFVIGGIGSHDNLCHRLAQASGAVLVSVDYRLAPEHPFPAAVEDCTAATRWCGDHLAELGGGGRLVVAGDSAGGNLAAVVARKCRGAGGPPIAAQVLVYPVTDLSGSHESRRTNGDGYLLTAADAHWFEHTYMGEGGDPGDPDVSPLVAPDLSGLPPALVVTAEYDPLRDEGEAYAERLRQAGVEVVATRYDGMIHGFFGMGSVTEVAEQAIVEVAEAFARLGQQRAGARRPA